MEEKRIYDKLESMLPNDIQYIDPYLDDVPLPLDNWCQFNIINVQSIGWNQQSRKEFNEEKEELEIDYSIQNIYTVQIDFYGSQAQKKAIEYKNILMRKLIDDEDGILDLKQMGQVENRTFLLENKAYQRRYGFDVDLFVIDTTTETYPYFDKINYKIINRGNNFKE